MNQNYLWLSDEQLKFIVKHTLDEVPSEACGIIAGVDNQAHRIIPVHNVAYDPTHHFIMDQRALSQHLPTLTNDGLDVIGFYHSHPDQDPIPSEADQLEAYWGNSAVHLIVGLKRGQPMLAVWRIKVGEVARIPLHIGENPPDIDDSSLSKAQKVAIIVTAVIAVALVLIISFTLLPPAPPIN
jgi:proteasome lid subunit RPN8/RPN11